jgi:predicted transcriptional regulator
MITAKTPRGLWKIGGIQNRIAGEPITGGRDIAVRMVCGAGILAFEAADNDEPEGWAMSDAQRGEVVQVVIWGYPIAENWGDDAAE